MKYFETLSPDGRRALYTFMKFIDGEVDYCLEEHRRLSPRQGEVAVGAAHFDPWLRAAVTQVYLSGLRVGKTPNDARDGAIKHGWLCVKKHNEKRPKDINWQRWEDSGKAVAENLHRDTPKPKEPTVPR